MAPLHFLLDVYWTRAFTFLAVQTNQARDNEKHKDNDKRTHKFPRGSYPPPVLTFYIHIQMSIVKVSHEPHLHLLLDFSTPIKYKVKMLKNLIQLLTNYPSHAPPGLVPR